MLENGGIPTGIARHKTYMTTETYFRDLLSLHDNRLRFQPNAINNSGDARVQMSILAGMRMVMPHYIDGRGDGPFRFTLTDQHQSNIFVDTDGHITSLIDLEWACSLPTVRQNNVS